MDEATAEELLPINNDNSIGPNYGHYMCWKPGDDTITLDSEFTLDELEAIVWWWKNHQNENVSSSESRSGSE